MLAINKVSGRWPVALKAAIAVAGPVFVAAWVGDARAGLLTGLGAFTVLYGPYTAGRFRVRLMVLVAAALTLCTAVGVLTHPWRVDTEQAAEDRRHLCFELLELQHVTNQSVADQPDQVGPYRTMFTALADLGYSVLGACWHPETYRVRRAAARASSAVAVIMAHPVTRRRPAQDLLAEVEAARSTLNDWS